MLNWWLPGCKLIIKEASPQAKTCECFSNNRAQSERLYLNMSPDM